MDELASLLKSAKTQFEQLDGVFWVPIRHHSPACSYYLLELLNEQNPDTVLIEGSIDFNAQFQALAHHETKTPVALYGGMGFFPLCDTSPEWQALQWGLKNNKMVRFIDLPLKDKAWKKEHSENGLISFIHESRLQHSEFVKKLVNQEGCRNSDELWERWFELKDFSSAQSFFNRVFEYCTSARLTYSEQAIKDSEDAAREAFMSQQIRLYADDGKKAFVITGGFHTYALLDYANKKHKKPTKQSVDDPQLEQSWLIRYSQDRLDAQNGYSAGMPAPDFYEQLFSHRLSHSENNFSTELILDILTVLDRNQAFRFPINTSAKLVICQQVLSLSALRGHSWPGLFDILDGIQSVLIKQELTSTAPLLSKAREALAGNRLGSVSSEQPPLPLVNEIFQMLKQARFKLESTVKVSTDIALYQSKSTSRLKLLYQCQFLGLEFADKESGPDWIQGTNLHLRHEIWNYAWTPWVEANLVALSVEGADWDTLLLSRINKRKSELEEQGLTQYQHFFVQLVLMGKLNMAHSIWSLLKESITHTTDCDQLSQLLLLLMRLRHTESDLFDNHQAELMSLVKQTWQQLMFSLPSINKIELDDGLKVLMQVQELTQEFEEYFAATWRDLWINQLQWMIRHGELSSGLLYACRSLHVELGQEAIAEVLQDLEALFDIDDEQAYSALFALLRVVPHWLKTHQKDSILNLLNTLLVQWDESRFLQSLPELRSLFSQLDPKNIELISSQLCFLNGWQKQPEIFDVEVDEKQILRAQKLQLDLIEQLKKEGLEHWISN